MKTWGEGGHYRHRRRPNEVIIKVDLHGPLIRASISLRQDLFNIFTAA